MVVFTNYKNIEEIYVTFPRKMWLQCTPLEHITWGNDKAFVRLFNPEIWNKGIIYHVAYKTGRMESSS